MSSCRGLVPGMTRILLIGMLMVLSPQLVWSAAAKYCGHEVGTSHPGHHSHEHEAPRSAAAAEASPANQSPASVADLDCGYCHGCVLQVPFAPSMPSISPPAASYPPQAPVLIGIERLREIERPKWQRAA
ncbi:DUF2946 family protein [Variovorax sp. OV329]|uniref:DUF2946 family protein n=1 Tax=Variovorax sp. OV329 TaxID=1882825 RepID=UPI0011138FA8|nr:DUF2946 family protein [Variovorax sp. OV329]